MNGPKRNRLLLLVVVLGYAALALAVTDRNRYLAYDEAIYLSQVYPGPALPFTAPRARGLTWLLAPAGWVDAPVPMLRGYLLAVEAGLMYLGFNAWLPVLRGRAVLAAAVFAVGWLPITHATEAFPNLPVAFGAVAAAGYLARHLGGAGWTAVLASAVAVAGVALVRPTEAVFVAAGLALAALLVPATVRPGRPGLTAGFLAAGLVIGWVPWLIEAQLRFGGPLDRLRAASANVGGGFSLANPGQYLRLSDGPVAGPELGPIPWLGAAWWLLLGGAAAFLLVVAVIERSRPRPGAVAAAVGVTTAGQYLFLTSVLQARFLLPAYAVLTVALVAALPNPAAVRRFGRAGRPLMVVAGLAFLAVFADRQITVARQVEADQVAKRQVTATLADAVRRRVQPPCVVASVVAFPPIAFGAGCQGAPFRPERPDITVAVGSSHSKVPPVYVLSTTDPAWTAVHPVPGSVQPLTADDGRRWWLFVAAPDEVVAVS